MADRPLRIAMLSVHSCPLGRVGTKDTGGMSVYIRELAGELGKLGHTVDVYTRVHDSTHPPVMPLGKNARLIHLKAGEDEQVHKLALYVHLPDFACQLENFRKRECLKYDLVYSHYWLSAWVGNLLRTWWDVPHLAMFHTLGAVKNSIGIGEEEPDLRIETERYLIRNCERTVAATAREKDDLVKHYGARPEAVAIIPCGVNLDLFRPTDKREAREQVGFNGDRTILFVGRMEPLKGIDRLLHATARLKDRPGLRLVVIGGDGNGGYETELRRLCQELHLQDMVTFLGLVKQEELPHFYSAADVCVIPSYYESFGLVALESLACGTPVVSTPVGVAESILRHAEMGYLVPDNAPHHLAPKIASILYRDSGTDASGIIRAAVINFSWTNVAHAVARECHALTAAQLTPPD